VSSLLAKDPGALERLPGIGKDLAGKIRDLLETGRCAVLDELLRKTPEGLIELMHVSGLGPKRAKLIHDALGVTTLDALELAAREGKLHELHGIGTVIERKVLDGVAAMRGRAKRFRLSEADEHVTPLVEWMKAAPGLERIEIGGSHRRRRDTVGDVDVLVAARGEHGVAERFLGYPEIAKVIAHGATRCAAELRGGLQVDVRIVPPESFGAALHYFTGSKAHNIAIRTLGLRRKLKINEYGVFRGTHRVGGRTEEEVFAAVGLPWIPPELREDRGEIDAARAGRLPELVDTADLRGDLHMHTDATDGHASLAEMVDACRRRGYEYVAITDHTHALRMTRGFRRPEFLAQWRAIDRLRAITPGIAILRGAEVDILEDGSLDLDDDTLAELDVVLVSVHSRLGMPRDQMTRRVCKAIAHPHVHVLSHPTGRLLGRREPYAIDLEAVIRVAKAEGVALEVNSQPDRLDLDDVHIQLAREAGVALVISSDAHRTAELDWIRYGVGQARRGWCEAGDIANTRPLDELRRTLRA
jgi:DNA polymerase (family 10)